LPGGQFQPMVHYAPLLSTLLAAIGWLGIDPQEGARWLNSACFAGSIALSASMIAWDSGSMASALCGAMLLMISVPMLEVHSMAWSEPPFIFLSLLVLLWLSRYRERGGTRLVIAAALAAGAAMLCRYAGITLIVAGTGALVVSRGPLRRRVRDAVVFALISSGLGGLALFRNWLLRGVPVSQPPAVHLIGLEPFRTGVRSVAKWWWLEIGPWRLPVALAVVGAVALMLRRLPQRRPPVSSASSPVSSTALAFVVGYGLVLLISISFFQADISLEDRILSPLFAWVLIGTVCRAHRQMPASPPGSWRRIVPIALAVWFAVAQLLHLYTWLRATHGDAPGYASGAWQHSEIVARVRALPPLTRIFSNGDDAIYILTGRAAERIPEQASNATRQPNRRYEAELARMHEQLSRNAGVIVYFARIDWRPNLVAATELQRRLRLLTVYAAGDGAIYALGEG